VVELVGRSVIQRIVLGGVIRVVHRVIPGDLNKRRKDAGS
jgi:hypothetical protein